MTSLELCSTVYLVSLSLPEYDCYPCRSTLSAMSLWRLLEMVSQTADESELAVASGSMTTPYSCA